MRGECHYSTRRGDNPACRAEGRIPRLTRAFGLVTCQPCRETIAFNSALRRWLVKEARK